MKTSAVLASVLFGACAFAAPFDKRSLVYKTEVVTETVVVYTTVYDDDVVAQATSTPAGNFYEVPQVSSSIEPSSSAAPAPPAAPASSAYVAPPQAPAPTPTPAPAPSPSPAPAPAPVSEQPKSVEAPKPVETSQAAAPASASAPAPASSPAPAPEQPSTSSGGSTGENSGDITIYQPAGAAGACGTNLADSDMVVALSHEAWGASTYDVMTGDATNKWCGQKIKVFYNGNSVECTIMDMCPGCKGMDIDLSPAAWKALTKTDEMTRYKATWSTI